MKTNFKRIGKQSISIVLAVMMMLSTLLVGMVTSNAEGTYTVYFTPDSSWVTNNYTIQANFKYGSKESEKSNATATDTKQTINGKIVYKADLYLNYDGLHGLQFKAYQGNTEKGSIVVYEDGGTWYTQDIYSGKYWNGSSWVAADFDSEQPTTQPQETTAPTPTGNNVIYFANPVDTKATYYLSTVNAYMWNPESGNNGAWPGVKINDNSVENNYTINGTKYNVYKISIKKDSTVFVNVIFNDGSKQTGNTTITDGALYYINDTSGNNYTLKSISGYKEPVAKHSIKLTSDSSSNATVKVGGNVLPQEVAEGDTYSLSATPSEGYYITKVTVGGDEKFAVSSVTDDNYATAKNEVTISGLTMGTADVDVKVETAEIVKPVITEITAANEIYFGNSISISANDNTESLPNGITATKKEFTVSPDTATIENGQFSVPKNLGETNSSIEYTVTYTVTLSNGEIATATKTITAKDSEEQTAYKTLVADLADTTNYPDPATLNPSDYTTDSFNAYKTAYDNAKNAITAGYPEYNANDCIAVLAALQAAKLTEKALATPVLGGTLNVGVKDTVTLSVTNESSFDDNVVFTIYKVGQETAITTLKKGDKYTAPASSLGAGSHQFYVVASLPNSDYKDSTSEKITVNVYETVDVSVTAGANGSAYISSYVAVSGAQTSTSLTSATVRKGSEVTFTAAPQSGYSVATWDGVANTSNTHTVTAESDKKYTVTFAEQSVHNFVLGGKNVKYVDNKSGDNGEVKSYDTVGALALVDDEVTFETNGDNNYFYLIDEDGNYYAHYTDSALDNFKVDSYNTSSNTFVLKKTDDTSAPVSRPYIENNGLYKLHVTKGDNADEYKCWIESVSFNSGWRIYGDKTHFNDWYGYKEPIIQSLGSDNKYYYSVTLLADETAYFGFYYNNQKHQPGNNTELPTTEGSMWANDTTVKDDTGVYVAYTITAATAGTYKICINTLNSSIWYEKEADQYYLMYGDKKESLTSDDNGKTVQNDVEVTKNNGLLSVTLDSRYFDASGSIKWYAFTSNATTPNSAMVGTGNKPNVFIESDSINYISNAGVEDFSQKYALQVNLNSEYIVKSLTITYNLTTNTYTVSATVTELPADSHIVYATKGNKVGLQYGTTTISLLNGNNPLVDLEKAYYREYVVNDKEQITVSCTVNKDQADLGYYVYAFVVNGEKVDVVDNGNNVYQTASPITVTKDLEITPIYYNKVIEADGNYITIYTNAPESLQTPWGNSISIYSWYNGTDSQGKKIEMDGAYPGQLMMRDSQGRFAAKVSKYAYTNVDGKFTCDKSKQVLGITNNSYYEFQDVHQKFLNEEQSHNNQTYDYDDFEKLTGMGYDTVEFDVKYYADKTKSNQELLVNNATDNKSMAGTTIIDKTATDYEDLTNIDGKLVSILGYTNETAKNNNDTGLNTAEPLQIISVGNQSMEIGTVNNKWSTIWYVYDSDGKYVTQGMPSDFIPRGSVGEDGNFAEGDISKQTEAYKDIVNAGLQYNSAVISYEIKMDATNSVENLNTGVRIDGRWYYARSTDQVDAKVGIIYRNSENDVWTVDKASDDKITGKVTGGSASFDYTDSVGSSHTNLASASVERNTIITLNATNGSTYKFIGWATPIYNEAGKVTGYSPLTITDLTASYQVSTATDLFAMYEPYPTGYVTITHSKYTGPDSHNGLGIFSVTAKVFDAKGNPVDSQAIATQSDAGSVTLENIVNKNDGSYIEVTLYTQSYAKSHFLNFYYPSVSNGVSTLKKEDNGKFYGKECPATDPATITYKVNVSDLFVNDKQTVMALNYYSDLKLPEVESNITFNYNPYNTAPNPNPDAGKGTGKTTFTLTITKKGETVPAFSTTGDLSSLTLKANDNIKSIIDDYVANAANGTDYTISIKLNSVEDKHCYVGKSYYQQNDLGSYTYKEIGNTVEIPLSEIYDISNNKFKTNTINLYTDFTAEEFSYNVTFKYLGYESRKYYNTNGFNQEQIPEGAIDKNWWKTYTVNGTFYGSDIDKYFDYVDGQYKFKESFLLKVAPYEDNFVQSITWDLSNVDYTATNDILSVTATVPAKYKNDFVTVTADLGNGKDKKIYSVNYASLVTADNLISPSTESNENSESKYLIVAPEINANGEKFSYWTIQTDDSNGIEVAKCYTREFNFLAYDNYLITACYGKEDVDASKKGVSATMQFLEYSRNQYDTGKDRVYADFAVAYNYEHLLLQESNNPNIVCGVAFVLNSSHKSDGNAVDTTFTVDSAALYNKVKDLNDKTTTDKMLPDGSKVFNYVIDKKNLDNKNRIEYNWSVDNLPANQQLTLLAYSYIYDTSTGKYSVSAPQSFKFYEVGNKSYEA